MHVLHVQVIGGYGVGDRVRRHELGLLDGEARHVLGIDLEGIISELGAAYGFETMRARRQVGVAPHPVNAINMRRCRRQKVLTGV